MSRTIPLAALAMGLAACSPPGTDEITLTPVPDEEMVTALSAPVAQAFTAALQAELAAALAEGGPVQAVGVCHEAAPRIAAEQSAASGAEVRRVSDRNRNPDGRVGDDLAPYYAELAAQPLVDGQPATRIWASGSGDDERVHYLSAIPMREQPCGTCHGSDIDPELQARIAELYPDDLPTGFVAGELRGALLVSWPAESIDWVAPRRD